MSRVAELAAAFALLTRLPVGRLTSGAADQLRAVWAYPVVGGFVGCLGGAVYCTGLSLGMPPGLAAAWTVAAQVLATGGLHEDGLADMADGLGGGTVERRLAIMRDSRIGTYGAMALVLAVGIRVQALATMPQGAAAMLALVVAGSVGRGAMLGVLAGSSPARRDGLAASLATAPRSAFAAGIAITVLAAVSAAGPLHGTVILLLAAGASAAMARFSRHRLGGHTGDVLGATSLVVESLVLTVSALR